MDDPSQLRFYTITNTIEVYYEGKIKCIGLITPNRGYAVFGVPYGLPSDECITAIKDYANTHVDVKFFNK